MDHGLLLRATVVLHAVMPKRQGMRLLLLLLLMLVLMCMAVGC